MCDTFYCAVGASGSISAGSFFGKNSDRQPDEPQTLCVVPRRAASAQARLGAKTYPVVDEGFAFVLSKPSWMGGGEMGMNEKGVAIGNEAVFSRFKPAKDGVLGMDILRAALGASATAKAAVDFICAFVENYEQGGNASFRGSLYYDNSFIVSDPSGAYILETAGHRWAWRAIPRHDAISNAYCIEEDFKRLDVATRKAISPVNEKAACSDEADPGRKGEKESFKAYVENRFYLRFSKGEQRRALSLSLLGEFAAKADMAAAAIAGSAAGAAATPGDGPGDGRPAVLDFFKILRSHGPFNPSHPLAKHMESLCVHSGGVPASATTASLVVEYRDADAAVIWFTGTSYPCVSLFKPMLLVKGEFIPLWAGYDYAEGSAKAEGYWKRWKAWLEKSRAYLRSGDATYTKGRDLAQEALVMIANKALADMVATGDLSSLPVLRQEAGAVIAGWEKDSGL
ncbi:MAG TPA: hypothetical protein VN445_08480 [Rectinemataceae bacterium]|nr:hypothetical protein [Rectinemataceae bacterium]